MFCKDINSCFNEIDAYRSGDNTGHVLLVNVGSYRSYQEIMGRLEVSANCVSVSEHCPSDGLPNLDDICSIITKEGYHALIGISQAAMLRSSQTLHDTIGKLLELPIRGHAVVLLDHAANYIQEFQAKSLKVDRKVVLLEEAVSPLPHIRLAQSEQECFDVTPLHGTKQLFAYLERLNDVQMQQVPEVTVITQFSPALFQNAVYSVTACDRLYLRMAKKYSDLASKAQESYGTEEQWHYLVVLLEQAGSFSAVTYQQFGSAANYVPLLGDIWSFDDSFRSWLLWLSMKVFGTSGNLYLSHVMQNCDSFSDFESHVFKDLLDISIEDASFSRYYAERKKLIENLPENLALTDSFCDLVGKHEKNAVYYLTDTSDREKFELMNCFSMYDYAEEELLYITKSNFPELYLYLLPFAFSNANMKLADQDTSLRTELADYFQKYKIQKLTNRIWPDFLEQVESYAETRPYNKLQARSMIVKKLPSATRENAQLFFFDALGLEYLSYIMAKCEEYRLIAELSISHSWLPSITEGNKEFIQSFKLSANKIDELDELKHHSTVIDYRKCKLPVHLFKELGIIDETLRQIHSKLIQGYFEQAVIVSDHGASRLAVIRNEENASPLTLDEKAEHSGRCCVSESDPHIPFAAYENGFAVLANYSRFKGGRKANVEVHGGASLEEVLVPVITLSRKPENIEICFTNSLIELHGKEVAAITLFSNIPLQRPRLLVNGHSYEGVFIGDQKHARFEMPELKRSRNCTADVYDGDKKLASALPFRIQKKLGQDVLQL